jgi:hypothetical protein
LSILIAILTLVLVTAVVLVVSAPLRSAGPSRQRGRSGSADSPRAATRSELEAAREAKYREIRDAELDYRTGKLSREDYEAIDGELRAEAIEILDRLESAEG